MARLSAFKATQGPSQPMARLSASALKEKASVYSSQASMGEFRYQAMARACS